MKKLFISLMLMLAVSISASALSSSDARSIALFLTDKMAYELNLTDEQYEAAYEVNYDYFLNLGDYDDLYGSYWNRRNLDLSYILGSSKYQRFRGLTYFYRPAYWGNNHFRYRIYSRYGNRNKFYFDRPDDYSSYNSEHSWRSNNGRSYFKGKDFSNGTGMRSSMSNGNSNNRSGSSMRNGSSNNRSGEMNGNSSSNRYNRNSNMGTTRNGNSRNGTMDNSSRNGSMNGNGNMNGNNNSDMNNGHNNMNNGSNSSHTSSNASNSSHANSNASNSHFGNHGQSENNNGNGDSDR